MRIAAFAVAIFCATGLSLPASAHHSHGNYDLSKWTLMEGTVKQVVFVTPHSIIYLDVKDGQGQVTTWSLEATSARGVMENGVKREDVRTGDTIRVRCHTLRDGSAGCLLGFVTPNHGDQARGHGIEKEWD
jgi:hypothetical protein